MRLPSTGVIVFGDPAGTTPLLERNQLAGLDVPLTVLAWDEADPDEATELVHATPEYLAARYALRGAPELGRIGATLRSLVEEGAGLGAAPAFGVGSPGPGEGIVSRRAEGDVRETVERLERAIEEQPGLTMVDTIDYRREARRERTRLRPTTLVLFSDPRVGTALMRARREAGMEFPQRILVYEDGGGATHVAYDDPRYLVRRHGIAGEEPVVRQLEGKLEALARAAS